MTEPNEPCPWCGHREWLGTYQADDGYPWESCSCGYRAKWAGGQMMSEFPEVKPVYARLGGDATYEIEIPPGILGSFTTLPEHDWQEYGDHARLRFVASKIADPSKPYSFHCLHHGDEDEHRYVVSTAISEFFMRRVQG